MTPFFSACFLEVRQVAFDNCDEEVRWRASINNVSRLLHTPLQKYLKSSSVRNIRQLGVDLASLHGNRKDADYNMGHSLTAGDSQVAIDDAQVLLDAFSRVAPEMIGNAMSEYIQRIYE